MTRAEGCSSSFPSALAIGSPDDHSTGPACPAAQSEPRQTLSEKLDCAKASMGACAGFVIMTIAPF